MLYTKFIKNSLIKKKAKKLLKNEIQRRKEKLEMDDQFNEEIKTEAEEIIIRENIINTPEISPSSESESEQESENNTEEENEFELYLGNQNLNLEYLFEENNLDETMALS